MTRFQILLAKSLWNAVIISLLCPFAGLSEVRAQGRPTGRKVIKLKAIKLEGRIQKPEAFYVLQRSSLNFTGLELKQNFIPKIIKSIEEQPF